MLMKLVYFTYIVCLSLLVTTVNPAKMAELIELQLGEQAHHSWRPKEQCNSIRLGGVLIPSWEGELL